MSHPGDGEPSPQETAWEVLCSSGFLGLRRFWVLSAVCKDLYSLREDHSPQGIAGVLSNRALSSQNSRRELQSLLQHCVDKDDVRGLRQLLAVPGMTGRFPGLFERAFAKTSVKCAAFLCEEQYVKGQIAPSVDIQNSLSGMTVEMLSVLIEKGALSPSAWVREKNLWRPLLTLLIETHNFECARFLLDRGARVDVWEHQNDSNSEKFESEGFTLPRAREFRTPLFSLVGEVAPLRRGDGLFNREAPNSDSESDEGGVDNTKAAARLRGLALLKLMLRAAKERGVLGWLSEDREIYQRSRGPLEVSVLVIACLAHDEEVFDLLICAGVAANQRCEAGLTAVRCVVDFGNEEDVSMLEKLADAGADLERKFPDTHTPLTLACRWRKEKAVEFLLKRGVDCARR
uniref:Uncharacterized protein n=1 Tax=Chromera velia CCMP2878 TaxID=1169474 RepID=A0A0G4FSY2_9ALVE|eukprot:Cvel_3715.t1-p1 / transcript=Cvel_3715.t1 / gene=Cvel_3715 / organism=Chromera_velia_CCMP2878 / gene_product=hypothetical protein / transcript_product=hypothetical protein / location=Cvel_scaffold154:99973-101175(+) / protein_length=401 / sequence_SO=supercontig / SO=protein_coding / is_pseudo=false